jgi:tetrahydrodipicolinate N-succinyltransferase
LVSQGVHLCAGTHDFDTPLFQLVAKPITIGAHAWVAAEAFVGPGTRVGEGAVVGHRNATRAHKPANDSAYEYSCEQSDEQSDDGVHNRSLAPATDTRRRAVQGVALEGKMLPVAHRRRRNHVERTACREPLDQW